LEKKSTCEELRQKVKQLEKELSERKESRLGGIAAFKKETRMAPMK